MILTAWTLLSLVEGVSNNRDSILERHQRNLDTLDDFSLNSYISDLINEDGIYPEICIQLIQHLKKDPARINLIVDLFNKYQPYSMDILINVINSDRQNEREKASFILSKMKLTRTFNSFQLIRYISDVNDIVKMNIITTLGNAAIQIDNKIMYFIGALCFSGDDVVKNAAINVLLFQAKNCDEVIINVLICLVDSKGVNISSFDNFPIKVAAIRRLGAEGIKAKSATGKLIKLLNESKDALEIVHAKHALMLINPDIYDYSEDISKIAFNGLGDVCQISAIQMLPDLKEITDTTLDGLVNIFYNCEGNLRIAAKLSIDRMKTKMKNRLKMYGIKKYIDCTDVKSQKKYMILIDE